MKRPHDLTPGTPILVVVRPDGLPTPCACCITRLHADPTIARHVGTFLAIDAGQLWFRVTCAAGTIEAALTLTAGTAIVTIDEHHPVCSTCGELFPCRHQRAEHAATSFAREIAQYETARRAAGQDLT